MYDNIRLQIYCTLIQPCRIGPYVICIYIHPFMNVDSKGHALVTDFMVYTCALCYQPDISDTQPRMVCSI